MNRQRWKIAAWVAFWIGVALAICAAVTYPGHDAGRFALLVVVAAVVAVVSWFMEADG